MERLLAYAQMAFSLLILGLFAAVILLQYFVPIELSDASLAQLGKLQDQLTIIVAIVVTYWFSRQRPQTPTDQPRETLSPE